MDHLKILENDVLSLFQGLPDELDEQMKANITEGIVRDLFEFLRELKDSKTSQK